jgi:hypothetical protein
MLSDTTLDAREHWERASQSMEGVAALPREGVAAADTTTLSDLSKSNSCAMNRGSGGEILRVADEHWTFQPLPNDRSVAGEGSVRPSAGTRCTPTHGQSKRECRARGGAGEAERWGRRRASWGGRRGGVGVGGEGGLHRGMLLSFTGLFQP